MPIHLARAAMGRPGVRATLFAFAYWVLLMGALTPGNVAHGLAAGVQPNWSREALRLAAAGMLGASVTPLLLAVVRNFPLSSGRGRNLALQSLVVAGLAPLLVLMSCFVAAWVFAGRLLPTTAEVANELAANTLLLVACLSLLLALFQATPSLIAPRQPANSAWVDRLTIGERGRLRVVELATVDWIETQGNYQALHQGDEAHLLRDTSKGLEAKLDPNRFVRIHRRYIVATDRVRQISPLANGDAIVRLGSGIELRQSRRYRSALRERLLS